MSRVVQYLSITMFAGCCAAACVSSRASAPQAPKPVALELVSARGPVEVRGREGGWTRIAPGATVDAVSEIRAAGGAVVRAAGSKESGAAPAKVWLRGGARARVGSSSDGTVLVDLTEGDVRVRGRGRDAEGAADGQIDRWMHRAREGAALRQGEVAESPERVAWSAGLEAAAEPMGVGRLEARLPDGTRADLSLRALNVKARLAGDLVETEVEHVFHSDAPGRIEGTFRFPLPDGAQLTGLAMEIDGRLVDGELVERKKARAAYDTIVDEMQDPALLEWDEGNIFTLRVFPIDANADKRVVLRYVAPLHDGVDGPELVYETAAPALQAKIPRFTLTLDGDVVVDAPDFEPGREIILPIAASRVPQGAVREERSDGVYTAIAVRPDFAGIARPKRAPSGSRRLAIVLDVSRSALEGRTLALDAIRAMAGELSATDTLRIVGCDISCRELAPEAPATETAIAVAIERAAAVEPDGATDLGLALRRAATMTEEGAQVVYVGDGTATWGVTAPAALRTLAAELFAKKPLYAVVVGKGASSDVVPAVVGASGGRLIRPRTLGEVRRYALFLAHADGLPRLRNAVVASDDSTVEVEPREPKTLFPGDALVAVVRTAPNAAPPSLRLAYDGGGRAIALGNAVRAPHVARRWATSRIAALEAQGGEHDAEIVRLSLDYGVMSKKTSFLVLESDEAYARFDIKRRAEREAEKLARVTGGDLDGSGSGSGSGTSRASLSPDQIQPGDPEIRIPAPADARSVVVMLPFGETKIATWEPALGLWSTRFLIDANTPDRTYQVLARITHESGEVEVLTLEYVVDTAAPVVSIALRPRSDGSIVVAARQVVTERELMQVTGGRRVSTAQAARLAKLVADVRGVDVALPDGQTLALHDEGDGELRAVWTPRVAPVGSVRLRVVATDRALNRRVFDAEVAPQ